jgi:hypothetical protein
MGLEGIVSKRLGSRYRSGRSPDWLKFKNPEMPPRRPSKKDSPAKLASRMKRRWRVVLPRNKGEILGQVEAPDVASAKPVAPLQRNRIMVHELG